MIVLLIVAWLLVGTALAVVFGAAVRVAEIRGGSDEFTVLPARPEHVTP